MKDYSIIALGFDDPRRPQATNVIRQLGLQCRLLDTGFGLYASYHRWRLLSVLYASRSR